MQKTTPMKTYRLYFSKVLLVIYLFVFAGIILAGITGIIVGPLWKIGPEGPPTWAFLLVLIFGLFNAYMWLRFPYQITIHDDTRIEFRSIFRRTTVSPLSIKSVRAKRYVLGYVDVAHQKGTVHLLNQIDGFHEFLATLKSLNPSVTIQGC